VAFIATPPNAGDFRLGITFTDTVTCWDTRRIMRTAIQDHGTFTASLSTANPANGSTERLLAATNIGGTPILAAMSTTDSHVSIYDISNPLTPVLLGSGNNTSGTLTANANGVGELAWGPVTGNSATLYAMNTNQGIQAFVVTIPPVPEPVMILPMGMALLVLRRARKNRN
jgi:hypothetical protein